MPRARHFLIPWLICGVINAQNVVQTAAGFEHPDPLQNLFQHHHQFQQQQLALGLPQHQLPPQLPPHPMLQHPLSAGAIPTLPPHHFMSHPFFFNHPAFLQHQLVAATAPPSLMATTTGRANIPPQAVKPSIQSDVKAFTEKNRPIDRSVEKLQTVSAEVRSPLAYSPAKELRKVEIVPVEHVLEPLVTTTQTIILTTTATRMATTTTTSEPSTTNLPQKIEEDRQNAEKNGVSELQSRT
uniref:Amelotin n=1 Tax=Bursaphelenchus xylophilus TaxID=6326 RepID=A0A1I7RZK6_BURXY